MPQCDWTGPLRPDLVGPTRQVTLMHSWKIHWSLCNECCSSAYAVCTADTSQCLSALAGPAHVPALSVVLTAVLTQFAE